MLRAPLLAGNERFTILRELGRGGMGIVYEAFDRERGVRVALKTLYSADATSLYRFKNEFRALADVAHENLVNLYELVADEDVWFFTMELVDGPDFLRYVRPAGRDGAPDVGRLRPALRQLVEGVAALHRAGKVHRDIKPSNVLVTEAGRVVLLDFGIAVDAVTTVVPRTAEFGILGTLEYVAPERCRGEPAAAASDWYSVGVLLYEALTGAVPFAGSTPYAQLLEKQESDPPSPARLAKDVPGDLADICMALLARSPAERLSGGALLERLGISESRLIVRTEAPRPGTDVILVGRSAGLAALEEAFVVAARGDVVALCVHGPSGIGKSTLIRYFTTRLAASQRAIVLGGRCYVRESVPYKALDGVMDTLARLLTSLPDATVQRWLPPEIGALTRVFPTLRRVEAVDQRAAESPEIDDPRELRRRAFAALRALLGAMSAERPIVIHIDDLQWADRDSADLLGGLLAAPRGLRVLFVLSFRREDVPTVPFLQWLLSGAPGIVRSLPVGPLAAAEAAAFARSVLGEHTGDAEAYAERLAQESAGNPFLLDQMVRFVLGAGKNSGPPSLDLGEMLRARIARMPRGAGALLEVLAIAGQPIDAEVAYRAAGLSGDERPLVTTLGVAHLVRADATGGRIDLYHDRIREGLVGAIGGDAARAIHRRLAAGLETKGIDDPESLYAHYLGAGDAAGAAMYAAQAARRAQAALAFERAALFYQRALDLSAGPGPETAAWCIGLGDALASAGRGGEAAQAYLRATPMVDGASALELERRAGQQLLISGRIGEGLDVLGQVLAKVGLALPATPTRAFGLLALRRVRLRLRGLKYRERAAAAVPPDQLTRIDTCWAVAEGMALVDNIQGAAFQALHLLLALEAGEPSRVARALAMEAGFVASSGSPREAAARLADAEALARRLGSPQTLGLCRTIGAVLAFHQGQYERAVALVEEAEAILARERRFAAWQLNIARVYHIPILLELGDIQELCRLSREWLADALDRGNLFAATMFRTGWGSLVWLVADDMQGATDALAASASLRRAGAFSLPDFYGLMSRVLIALYTGDAIAAHAHIVNASSALERSQLLRIKRIRARFAQFRASCAVAAAAERGPTSLLRAAERDARWIERQRHTLGRVNEANGRLLRAAIEAIRGRRGAAVEQLRVALGVYTASGLRLYEAVTRRRLGELLGGDEGADLIAASDRWMREQSVVRPDRFTAAFAPGFPAR
jgi:hypothetical protein